MNSTDHLNDNYAIVRIAERHAELIAAADARRLARQAHRAPTPTLDAVVDPLLVCLPHRAPHVPPHRHPGVTARGAEPFPAR